MPAPVLDTAALNRTLLDRQLLLRRARLSIPAALERVGGLQSQYAPTAYIGLWTRLAGFQLPMLTVALMNRSAVQGTLMRATIHIVSTADYPLLAAGVQPWRRSWWLAATKTRDPGQIVDMAVHLRQLLAAGPRLRRQLIADLTAAGFPREAWEGVGLWLDMVRVPPSGTWERRRADLYGLADDWLGTTATPPTAEGMQLLVERYLGGFGPAAPSDVASWAGIPIRAVRETMERMQLRAFRAEDGGSLFDLPRRRVVTSSTPAPVRFLGPWEAALLVHARRARILPEEYRPEVFSTKNPHSVGTFLVDGSVAGAWRQEAGSVSLTPFAPLPRVARRQVTEEAEALAAQVFSGSA